jgi:hypothetical protein
MVVRSHSDCSKHIESSVMYVCILAAVAQILNSVSFVALASCAAGNRTERSLRVRIPTTPASTKRRHRIVATRLVNK